MHCKLSFKYLTIKKTIGGSRVELKKKSRVKSGVKIPSNFFISLLTEEKTLEVALKRAEKAIEA